MVGYDAKAELVKHFRVDKMLRIQPMKCKRKGQKLFPQGNIANYAEKHFGMFSGKEESVTLLCQNGFIGVIVDRFGRDVKIRPVDEDHFQAKVEVVSVIIFWMGVRIRRRGYIDRSRGCGGIFARGSAKNV